MDNLAITWDNTEAVRERLRSGCHLMRAWSPELSQELDIFVDKSVENIKINAPVLSPIFKLVKENDRTTPCIDRIMVEVASVFARCKVQFTKHQDRIYQDSWAIRRLCTYAKAQQFRDGPPKENI